MDNVYEIIEENQSEMDGPLMLDVSTISRKYLDVPYADQSPNQKLDIYLPKECAGPFPTMVFAHGGAFFAGDKRDVQAGLVLNLIKHGFAVVSVEYRLSGEARFPYGLFDFKAAIRFLRAQASKYSLNGNRFASGGDSAGGYYNVMAAATQGNPAFEDLSMGNAEYSSRVQAVVSWYATYNFTSHIEAMRKMGEGAETNGYESIRMLFGGWIEEIPGIAHFSNTLNFIKPEFPPLLILHGDADVLVPLQQTHDIVEKINSICGPGRVEYYMPEGYEHGDQRFFNKEWEDIVVSFLKNNL